MRRAGLREICCWLLGRRERFQVAGASMGPVLSPGDQVLLSPSRPPRVGDVVVARHPYRTDVHVVKRVVDFDARGACVLRGDNPAESSDSRVFGNVPRNLILGTVTSRIGGAATESTC